jgi:RNA polymerase sigma-70 factor (ECF subfamily)
MLMSGHWWTAGSSAKSRNSIRALQGRSGEGEGLGLVGHTLGVMLASEADWVSAYDLHADDVYKVARVILRSADDAGEVVQSTFEAAFRHRHRFDNSRSLRAWLMGIASHEALHLARRERIRSWLPLGPSRPAEETHDPAPVWQAVNSLPPGHRACVALFYLHGFSMQEIAAMLRIPQGTVASRLHTARRRLRELLSEAREEVTV